jgi:hypothetical protein
MSSSPEFARVGRPNFFLTGDSGGIRKVQSKSAA